MSLDSYAKTGTISKSLLTFVVLSSSVSARLRKCWMVYLRNYDIALSASPTMCPDYKSFWLRSRAGDINGFFWHSYVLSHNVARSSLPSFTSAVMVLQPC
jgi:hypothetical protein